MGETVTGQAGVGDSAEHARIWPALALLAVAVGLVYWPVVTFEFIPLDDPLYVQNRMVSQGLSWKGVIWAFTEGHPEMPFYFPLTWLSLMLDVSLFGVDSGMMHLTNLVIHLAAIVMLFLFMAQSTQAVWRSFLVAGLVAIHPTRVESVAWVTERKDVLFVFFLAIALLLYRRATIRFPGKALPIGALIPVLLFFVCGLFSKAMAVTFPVMLLLLDYWPLRRHAVGWPRLWMEKAPFFVLGGGFALLQGMAAKPMGFIASDLGLAWYDRLFHAVTAYGGYLGKTFWPVNLIVFYQLENSIRWAWSFILSVLALSFVSWAVIRFRVRFPYLMVGWLWFLVALAPVSGLFLFLGQHFADRFAYWPHVGLFLALVWASAESAAKWRSRPVLSGLLAGALLIFTGMLAHAQVALWRNGEVLLEHCLRVDPDNFFLHRFFGVYLGERGRWAEARPHFLQNLAALPGDSESMRMVGMAALNLGDREEAEKQLTQAVALSPGDYRVRFSLAEMQLRQGDPDGWREEFSLALSMAPDPILMRLRGAEILFGAGFGREASDLLEEVVVADPGYLPARLLLGTVLVATGRSAEAVDHLKIAARALGDDGLAYLRLGWALNQQGRFVEGEDALRRALTRLPDHPQALFELGYALSGQGRRDEAAAILRRCLERQPGHSGATALLLALTEEGGGGTAVGQP